MIRDVTLVCDVNSDCWAHMIHSQPTGSRILEPSLFVLEPLGVPACRKRGLEPRLGGLGAACVSANGKMIGKHKGSSYPSTHTYSYPLTLIPTHTHSYSY